MVKAHSAPFLLLFCAVASASLGCSPTITKDNDVARPAGPPKLEPPPFLLPPPLPPRPDEDQDKPSFLATLTITGGVRLTGNSAVPCRTLSFQAKDHTLLFTERPTRQAVNMPTAEYVAAWKEAYEASPPNAQIQLFGAGGTSFGTVVKLDGAPTWDAATKTVTFPKVCAIAVAGGEPIPDKASFEVGALFVDGATAFKWNSCFSGSTNGGDPNSYEGCLEQWGSYAASCQKIARVKYDNDKRCKHICGRGECKSGQCYKKYDSSESGELMASAYHCE